ncbi:MAG: preprotein translocase subunit SecY [Bacteroidales bacterium]|nr:preprotein translocase subunit SecY [Candidatus Liminaster caballi]
MRIFETFKNIWKIEELRNRILWTIGLCAVYRLGSFIVLPGIDAQLLASNKAAAGEGLLALLDMFSGGAFSNASIFALGIMPYISASIVIQLLTMVVPSFQKLSRDGESGHNKINQYTRQLTVLILIFQSWAYISSINSQYAGLGTSSPFVSYGAWFVLSSIVILTAGSMFVMWLGERITDKGIGNGISFLIMIGIIARLPQALSIECADRNNGAGGLVMFLLEIFFLLVVIAFSIMLVQGTRKVPVQYAKQIRGNRQYGGVRQYIPLKVNAAGVMPIIFAQAIMFVPMVLSGFTSSNDGFWSAFTRPDSFAYNAVLAVLIIVFTYFYTAITMNPVQMAEAMKSQNGFIPGIKPGKATADFLDTIMTRITFPGSVFLAVVAILPCIARLFGVSTSFAQFFGGTSLLILVGVVLDTLQQIESHLMMHHYDGLMKSGRIKGRTGSVAAY